MPTPLTIARHRTDAQKTAEVLGQEMSSYLSQLLKSVKFFFKQVARQEKCTNAAQQTSPISVGQQVYIRNFVRRWKDSKFEGPYLVTQSTPTAVKIIIYSCSFKRVKARPGALWYCRTSRRGFAGKILEEEACRSEQTLRLDLPVGVGACLTRKDEVQVAPYLDHSGALQAVHIIVTSKAAVSRWIFLLLLLREIHCEGERMSSAVKLALVPPAPNAQPDGATHR
ncbi:hypothetical protein NDU88_004427 [Pleurodeles waltl]|uniref:Uncharacterized protein n=1 Tax=Pleurodeles waltl TaxID=8319 RepID=A0AAV7NNE4_PLEWA|nr:hypothetical protein NDU88_004427 [Pleurodeles waltl]